MKKFMFLVTAFFGVSLYAQVGFGTTTPNAALEISSSTDGFLMPRVALSSKNVATIITPTVSLLCMQI